MCLRFYGWKCFNCMMPKDDQSAGSLNFRSCFFCTKYTSLGANLPEKALGERAPWYIFCEIHLQDGSLTGN